jgi:hypothetical protein
MLIKALWKEPAARVVMPDNAKFEEYCSIIAKRHPTLSNIFCVADGLKLVLKSTNDLDNQSMYFNGW